MDEHQPPDEQLGPLTWENLRREALQRQEARRRFRDDMARLRAETRAAIEIVKQNEALAARRRCWLF